MFVTQRSLSSVEKLSLCTTEYSVQELIASHTLLEELRSSVVVFGREAGTRPALARGPRSKTDSDVRSSESFGVRM